MCHLPPRHTYTYHFTLCEYVDGAPTRGVSRVSDATARTTARTRASASRAMTTTPPRPPTRAIFFDLDDTLVDTASADARAYEAARRTLATTRDDARDDDETDDDARSREDAATRAVERYKRAMVTRTPWDETRREHVWKTRERMWVEAAAAGDDDARGGRAAARANVIFRDVRLETLKIRERVREGIARLRSRGIGVGIITNGHEIVQREKLAACGAYACVDGKNILVGGEEVLAGRGEKPCASIFREACARVGVGPGEAVHVGDSWRADARGALDAGLRAAWISAGRSTPDDGHDDERLRVFTTIDAFFDHVESATGEEDAWCRFEERRGDDAETRGRRGVA